MARKKKEGMDEQTLKAIIANQLAQAEDYDDRGDGKDRARALEYIQGKMTDVPAEVGRSSVVSRDVADAIAWMLPGIMRVFTASDSVARVDPVEKEDEDYAEQASDGINHVFLKENNGYKILFDATYDALSVRNAIVKVWYDDTPTYSTSFHDGLSSEALAMFEADPEVEILAQTDTVKQDLVQNPETGERQIIEYPCHEVKIRRIKAKGQIRVECIPREDYKQNESAKSIDSTRFQSHKSEETRSDLIEMGFDRKLVESLALNSDDSREEAARDADRDVGDGEAVDTSTELVDLYECFLYADVDGDGISEHVRAYYAGSRGGGELLDWEVWEDDNVFFDIPCNPIPHRFEGESIFDELKDVQQVKTVLQRQGLDNIYATNIPQRQVEEGTIINMDELMTPNFGGVVIRKKGSAPILPLELPFVASHAFEGLNYYDQVTQRRTGVTRQTAALDPEALTNQTATANNNEKDASYSQIEQIARNMAELGWAPVFKAILRLMVKHQDKAKTIRLRNEWVEIDPRHWNSDMDVTINIGLGTGSRERDLSMLNMIYARQLELAGRLLESGLEQKALEMLPLILNTARKMAECTGLKVPDQYFPEMGDEEMKQALETLLKKKQQPSPDEQKLKAEMQMEEKKLEISTQQEAMKAEVQRDKEKAQMEADIVVERERMQSEFTKEQQRIQADAAMSQADRELKLIELNQKREIELLKLNASQQAAPIANEFNQNG